jgi:preprotein translocase subunit SecD
MNSVRALAFALCALPATISPLDASARAEQVRLVLKIDDAELLESTSSSLIAKIRSSLRREKIGYSGLRYDDRGVVVKVTKPEFVEAAELILRQVVDIASLGHSGKSTFSLVVNDDSEFLIKIEQEVLVKEASKKAAEIIRIRVQAASLENASVVLASDNKIIAQYPETYDREMVSALLTMPLSTSMRLLCLSQPTNPQEKPPTECSAHTVKTYLVNRDSSGESGSDADSEELRIWLQKDDRAIIASDEIVDATYEKPNNQESLLVMKLSEEAKERFGVLTSDNVGNPIAIVVDDYVYAYPLIKEPIEDGLIEMKNDSESFDLWLLALAIQSGPLPANLLISE